MRTTGAFTADRAHGVEELQNSESTLLRIQKWNGATVTEPWRDDLTGCASRASPAAFSGDTRGCRGDTRRARQEHPAQPKDRGAPRRRRLAELSIAQTGGDGRLWGRLPSTWTGDSDSSEAGADLLPAANAERRDEAGQALPSRHRSPMRCGPTGRIGRPQVEAHGAGVGVDHSAAVAESRGPEKESGASAAIAEWDQGVNPGVSLWRRIVRVARG